MTLDELSYLLWASNGVSAPGAPAYNHTAPSAGRTHPIETWISASRVDGLESGIYRYVAEGHALELYRKGDYEEVTVKAAAGQEWIHGSCVVFIWIAEFARTTNRYKDRGYRYVFLDAGHICQNLYLAVESLSFGMTAIAALIDDEVNALVGADGVERSIVYMAGVGKPQA
jgi:SagB-type dehydrogenase family enzyme